MSLPGADRICSHAVAAAVAACLGLSACASADGSGDVASFTLPGAPTFAGTPASLYIQVGRGAKACWFLPGKPLANGSYLFTADVRPESKGGDAVIVIYERTPGGERGLKAFAIAMARSGETSTVSTENYRIAEPLGAHMRADVERWAAGETGCEPGAVDWQAGEPADEKSAAGKKAKKAKTSKSNPI